MPVKDIQIRVVKMSEQGEAADLRKTTTPQERLEIVWQLSQNTWQLEENQLLSQDFIDILSAFSEEKVDYLLVGSYAMAFHGWARATGDIDLWINPTEVVLWMEGV